MRYSSVNHWYKIQQVLDGLEGTSSDEVQRQLLQHLGKSHIQRMACDGGTVSVHFTEGETTDWVFRTASAAESFCEVVREWFTSQKVVVPAK